MPVAEYGPVIVCGPTATDPGSGEGGALTAEEEKQLKEILEGYKDDPKAAKEVEDLFRKADQAGRKKLYDDFKKDSSAPEPLSVEEEKQLKEMLAAYKDDPKAAKEVENLFRKSDRAGRKKLYGDFKKGETDTQAPALLIVNLPQDAKLKVGGSPTVSTSSPRIFESPVLTPGSRYTYTLEAEYTRNGTVIRTTQKADVVAGKIAVVRFKEVVSTVASK